MLEIRDISKSFGGRPVLREVSFSVKKGQIYGLIGKNGAGKTTLLTIVAGLAKADSGECQVDGTARAGAARIGYLPDIPAFFDYLSTREYMDFLLMNRRNKAACERRNELLKLAGLTGKEKIHSMSRGMKQRLGIAAALVSDPTVLLLDEPTSALDPEGRHELMELLKVLKGRGKCIILSTHILADMERVCDRVGFLHKGRIQKELDVRELEEGEQNRWEITFEPGVRLPDYEKEKLAIEEMDGGTYVFKTSAQKYLLEYLLRLPARIRAIRNKRRSLDEIFQEVCR